MWSMPTPSSAAAPRYRSASWRRAGSAIVDLAAARPDDVPLGSELVQRLSGVLAGLRVGRVPVAVDQGRPDVQILEGHGRAVAAGPRLATAAATAARDDERGDDRHKDEERQSLHGGEPPLVVSTMLRRGGTRLEARGLEAGDVGPCRVTASPS